MGQVVVPRPTWMEGQEQPPGAAEVRRFLAGKGIDAEIAVRGTGEIVVHTEATPNDVYAALAEFDPATDAVPERDRKARGLVRDVRQDLAALEALPAPNLLQQGLIHDKRLLLAVVEHRWPEAASDPVAPPPEA
jgi:hypothetical protein